MPSSRRSILLTALLAVVAMAGTAVPARVSADETPLRIVTTIAQIADAATEIAGERADVDSLMGEGVDPHTYRQTRSDIVKLRKADLVLYNGLYLEAQLEPLLLQLAEHQPVVAVAARLDRSRLLEHEDYEGKFDPHVWMDVALWRDVVAELRDALIAFDPDHEAHYRDNAEAYLARLDELEAYAREVLMSVPEEKRVLITAHDAFQYFGRAYDFEVIGIQGLSTESEAGLRRIEELVDLIVERDIGAVFVETSVADRNVRALIEGAAAQDHEVVIGGELYSDAMGAPGTYEGTYVGMIDQNVTAISRALGGSAPQDGLHGRLGS